jgi:transposase
MATSVDIILSPEDIEYAKNYLSTRYTVMGECHVWNMYKDASGYGRCHFRKRFVCKVHRLSYAAHHDGILRGYNDEGKQQVVRHLCKNPSCYRIEHLTIGTIAENYEDRRKDGTMPIGSKHTNAKLTEEQVQEIIELLGTKPKRQIALEYGVTSGTILGIAQNKIWRHVPRKVPIAPVPANQHRPKPITEWTPELINKVYMKLLTFCFESKNVHPELGTPCLLWKKGKPILNGRGRVPYKGNQYNAPKVACMYREQRMCPPKWVTRHLCGQKRCCRPEHLKFDTEDENARDRVRLKEMKTKLTAEQVLEIRRRYLESDSTSQAVLAAEYGVNMKHIWNIIHRKTWTHI